MSVLACSRRGCESIMCDTYVPGVGYICSSCQEKFKVWSTNVYPTTEKQLVYLLQQFMGIDKSMETIIGIDIDKFFADHTK